MLKSTSNQSLFSYYKNRRRIVYTGEIDHHVRDFLPKKPRSAYTVRCRMDARTAARYRALWVHGISTNRGILVPISCVNHLV